MSMLVIQGAGCIIAQRPLIEEFGRTAAQLLQQIHHWIAKGSGREMNGERWVYNTLDAWAEQLNVCSLTIYRAIKRLKASGVLRVQSLEKNRFQRTLSYSINYDRLHQIIPSSSGETSLSLQPFSQKIRDHSNSSPPPLPILTKCKDREEQKVKILTKRNSKDLSMISDRADPPDQMLVEGKKEDVPNQLLTVWNETVGAYVGISSLNAQRARWLMAAFQRWFDQSLEKWQRFCEALTQSAFLMGRVKSTFKAHLDWILKFDILQRLKEGQFGVLWPQSDEEADLRSLQFSLPSAEDLLHDIGDDTKDIRRRLMEVVGMRSYQSWFHDADVFKEGSAVRIQAASCFKKDYIASHYVPILQSMGKGQEWILC